MEIENHIFTVETIESDIRLDKFVADHLRDLSREQASQLINEGGVLVDGKLPKKGSIRLRERQEVIVNGSIYKEMLERFNHEENLRDFSASGDKTLIVPEDLPLDIVHEEDDFMVVNKPAGLVVHPSAGIYHGTLVNAIAGYFKKIGLDVPTRVGLVNRLDKDVSGLMVIAKNVASQKAISVQFDSTGIGPDTSDEIMYRKAHKHYLAKVSHDYASIISKNGLDNPKFVRWEGYIQRARGDRRKFEYQPGLREGVGRYCRSYVRLKRIEDNGDCLFEVLLVTGRTHQIRSQFAGMKIPISGDVLYGSRKQSNIGIGLVCYKLCIIPPWVYKNALNGKIFEHIDTKAFLEGDIEKCLNKVNSLGEVDFGCKCLSSDCELKIERKIFQIL